MKRLAFAMALLLAVPALADSDLPAARWANEQLPDARQEAQAKALMEMMAWLIWVSRKASHSVAWSQNQPPGLMAPSWRRQ